MVEDGLTSKGGKKRIYMLKLYENKMVVLLVSVIFLMIFFVGFFYQFEVDYSNYKRIERIDGDGFYPDAYVIFHTEKEFLESAVYEHHGSKESWGRFH